MFISDWPRSEILWQQESREKLNRVIHEFNEWQIEDDDSRIPKLLRLIDHGKQTIATREGGSGYLEELNKMEAFIKEYECQKS